MTDHPLPERWVARMRDLLGDEAEPFLRSQDEAPTTGLRINPLKATRDQLVAATGWELTPVPWCPDGYLVDPEVRPGRHPLHAAGLFYLQEPSAMAVAEAVAAQPGEVILDLAASPGGKATQLASQLRGEGVLVANDPGRGRAKGLTENLERWGAANVAVTGADPARLALHLAGGFDRVLLDAPCSGEGMFRKVPAVRTEWSEERVAGCAARQEEALDRAAALVRPGGLLVYSTCTFNPDENERQVAAFLCRQPGWEIVPVPHPDGVATGRPEWGGGDPALAGMARFWPHLVRGEGHAVAALRRGGDSPVQAMTADPPPSLRPGKPAPRTAPTADPVAVWQRFAEETLPGVDLPGDLVADGAMVWLQPAGLPSLAGLPVVRRGMPLGEALPGRFEPSHALALWLQPGAVPNRVDLDLPAAERYLAGEPLSAGGPAGWTLVTVLGWPLGWGRRSGSTVKNHYPKGLRRALRTEG